MILYFVLFIFPLTSGQIQCPNNVSYQSTNACDPDLQDPCQPGFRCRPGTVDAPATNTTNSTALPSQVRFLCCSSANMSISQYFIESGISPTVVPIVPLTSLSGVVMRDNATGNLFNVDGIGEDLTVNATNMVCNMNTGFPGGVFTQLDTVVFTFPPDTGEYLHFVVGIDNLLIPSAIFVYYNYPSFGEPILNLTELQERFPRGYAQTIGNSSIPWDTQYKPEFVVLVFKTPRFIDNNSMISSDVIQSQGDLGFLLSTTSTGQLLGAPILGTIFRLRTPNTIFQTTNSSSTPPPTQSSPSLDPLLFLLASVTTILLLK
ncbi:hypothetical protein FO519_006219 [Halicephalobus sp. NKZ332]|nr:hypothetical protein FO519_006219 [Halicephalobus sp. NKZ332]